MAEGKEQANVKQDKGAAKAATENTEEYKKFAKQANEVKDIVIDASCAALQKIPKGKYEKAQLCAGIIKAGQMLARGASESLFE